MGFFALEYSPSPFPPPFIHVLAFGLSHPSEQACWIFSQFYSVKFENPDIFRGAVQKVVSMMHDPDFPVRVQAALALRFLILAPAGTLIPNTFCYEHFHLRSCCSFGYSTPGSAADSRRYYLASWLVVALCPNLLLLAIFKLLNELDNDDLVATLERLIFHYDEEIAPYSVALCQRLVILPSRVV